MEEYLPALLGNYDRQNEPNNLQADMRVNEEVLSKNSFHKTNIQSFLRGKS